MIFKNPRSCEYDLSQNNTNAGLTIHEVGSDRPHVPPMDGIGTCLGYFCHLEVEELGICEHVEIGLEVVGAIVEAIGPLLLKGHLVI